MWIHLINTYILYRTEVGMPFRPYKICALLSVLHGETLKYSFVHFQNILKKSQISYIPWCMAWMCTDWYTLYVESLLFDSTVPHSKVEWDFLHCVISPFIITVKTVNKVNTYYSYILFWLLKNCTHTHACMWSKHKESMKEFWPLSQDWNYKWFMLVNEYRKY
jgi:hypothetical protein